MGAARFERATSASQTQNHTKLDHTPSEQNNYPNLSVLDYDFVCQEITIIKSEIHNLIIFVYYDRWFPMEDKAPEELRKDLVKIEVRLIKSEIRFLKFMLKNARYQQNSMLKEIIR